MTLTKKHFKAIAEILNREYLFNKEHNIEHKEAIDLTIEKLTNQFSDYFQSENSNFDRSRFIDAVKQENS